MKSFFTSLILIIALSPTLAKASIIGDFEKLEGMIILHANEFEKIYCHEGFDRNCDSHPTFFYRSVYRDVCVSLTSACGTIGCDGIIARDIETKKLHFFNIDTMSKNVKGQDVEIYECPDRY